MPVVAGRLIMIPVESVFSKKHCMSRRFSLSCNKMTYDVHIFCMVVPELLLRPFFTLKSVCIQYPPLPPSPPQKKNLNFSSNQSVVDCKTPPTPLQIFNK